MTRYGTRFREGSWIPTVEVTVPTIVALTPMTVHHEPVKRVRGFTSAHAMSRAIAWTREHGDPR